MPDVSNNPVLLWIVIAVMALVVISDKFPGILGGFGRGLQERRDRRRRAAVEDDDADIAELRRQLGGVRDELTAVTAELKQVRDEARAYRDKHDAQLAEHQRWDQEMVRIALELDHTVPLPERPALWPQSVR